VALLGRRIRAAPALAAFLLEDCLCLLHDQFMQSGRRVSHPVEEAVVLFAEQKDLVFDNTELTFDWMVAIRAIEELIMDKPPALPSRV